MLLEAGADKDAKSNYGYTPLHNAALMGGKEHVARMLLEAGADKNAKDNIGDTPLKNAESQWNHKVAELLRSYGATK